MGTGGLPVCYQSAVWEVSSTGRVVLPYQATQVVVQDTVGWLSSFFRVGRRAPFPGDGLSGPAGAAAQEHRDRHPAATGL